MSVAPPPLPNAISGFGAQNGTEEQPLAQETEQEDVASVGIIYPPPYIREIADKTAAYVSGSDSGALLEERLRQKEKSNPKFCFLNTTDPYHAYYAFKIQEAKSGKAPKAAELKAEVEAKIEEAIKPPPEEPPALEFMTPMPSVSAQDLDIIKLTAQFVARNGRQFMVSLAQREARNYQFDFLRPNHSLFSYFSKLVEQYTKILVPGPGMVEEIEARANDKYAVQDIVMRRVEYTAYQQELRKKKDEKEDAERQAFLSINWQDFVVVQTIEFTEADELVDLPLPKSLKELENMSLAQKRMIQVLAESEHAPVDAPQDIEIDGNDDDMDMEDSDAEDNDDAENSPAGAHDVVMTASQSTAPMKIKEDFVPKAFKGRTAASLKEATQTCPRCGEQIPLSEMDEHVRIELLDPRFKELREQADAKTKASNMVTDGTDVARNLSLLKSHRTDIFSEEQTRNAEEERKRQIEREKNVWDGQTATVAKTAQRHAAAAVAASASGSGYGHDASSAHLQSSIGPQRGQPPMFPQVGGYNRMPPGMAPPLPPPGMAPPGMPGIPPPQFFGQQPPHGYYPGMPMPPGMAPPPGMVPPRHPDGDQAMNDRDPKRFKQDHN
ncbi:Pre-mRNA splicing factor PRP21 like protein-domain-containing protein [Linnemannia elongata]|nr:SF3a splicing factor complex subunit [Linnemannia elongata]KAH7056373.1 Pre-mRNA splicing factor PRP21 like protein-domain-containing protein [Linnemannia elongata]